MPNVDRRATPLIGSWAVRQRDADDAEVSRRQQRRAIGGETRPARKSTDEPPANLAPGNLIERHHVAAEEVGEVHPPALAIILYGAHSEADVPALVDDA